MSATLREDDTLEALASDEEYVEEEVTDDEDEGKPSSDKDGIAAVPSASSASIVNVSASEAPMEPEKKRTPAISDAVKKTISESPGASASRSGPLKKSTPDKITLANTGDWTKETFSEVNIIFPTIGAASETTNDLTRQTKPENRYWRGDLKFSLGSENSQTIRVFNVPIPYAEGAKYGSDYVYMALPGFMSEHFSEVGKRRRPTVINEPSLVPDSTRWWKIANNITDKFGVGSAANKSFRPINIQTVLSSTMKGVIANVELKFSARCSTTEAAKLTATNPQRITIELIRAYITATDQDIELPVRVAKVTNTVKPGATRQDFATDDVMKRLKDLGL